MATQKQQSEAPATGRRTFLKAAALSAAPYFVPSTSLGLTGSVAPSDRVTLGCIGMGLHGIGWNLNRGFLKQSDARVVAVCDVYAERRAKAKNVVDKAYGDVSCETHADWREVIERGDVDAVVISTPDHWHTVMAAAASKAGKDVFCEKPTLTIAEGRELIGIVRANNTVFQTATEDRSIPQYHRMAELVRNGRIGQLQTIRITLPRGIYPEPPREAPVPKGFDYDMWLGPAPEAPYYANRCGVQQWRNISDYSGGKFADWGAHMLDTAQWAMDTERTGPTRIKAHGVFPPSWSLYDLPIEYQVHYGYPSGVEVIVTSGGTGIRCEGSDGWIDVPKWRAPLEASHKRILKSV
ncbi:MAG: Gfo/Idh/MocA family oxidoreductase, partial [Planctomycetota bacterium]